MSEQIEVRRGRINSDGTNSDRLSSGGLRFLDGLRPRNDRKRKKKKCGARDNHKRRKADDTTNGEKRISNNRSVERQDKSSNIIIPLLNSLDEIGQLKRIHYEKSTRFSEVRSPSRRSRRVEQSSPRKLKSNLQNDSFSNEEICLDSNGDLHVKFNRSPFFPLTDLDRHRIEQTETESADEVESNEIGECYSEMVRKQLTQFSRYHIPEIKLLVYLASLRPSFHARDEIGMPNFYRMKGNPIFFRIITYLFFIILLSGICTGVGVLVGTIGSSPSPSISAFIRPQDILIIKPLDIWPYSPSTSSFSTKNSDDSDDSSSRERLRGTVPPDFNFPMIQDRST